MKTSTETKDLFIALAKAQGEFKSIPMDKKNPHFNSRYASLTATQEATRDVLSKNGLALIQAIDIENEFYYLETMLTHSSGQWISSRLKLLLDRQNMQGMGSATTYAKRYAWQAMLGVVGDEDDDGNAASTKIQPSGALPKIQSTKKDERPAEKPNFKPITKQDLESLHSLCIDRQIAENVFNKLIIDGYGYEVSKMPFWVAKEVGTLLEMEDTNEATLMAQCQRVITRRESKRLLDEGKK